MQRIRYEVDPFNRLIIDKRAKKSGLPKFRKVIDGRFKIDGKNELNYHVKAPLEESEHIPHQFKIKGRWSLTDDHDLRLTIEKSGRETFGDEITLKGQILDVNENSLLFAVTTRQDKNKYSTYLLRLGGSWKADKFNRLSFYIEKEKGKYDILTFNGVWEIDKNHQIVYQYEKGELIRKKRRLHTLTFKGYWDIRDKFRISYLLSKDSASAFNFQTAIGVFDEDFIKYEIGIRLTNRVRPIRQMIILSGKWGLKKDVGLIFEIECEDKKTPAMIFGADVKLTAKDTIAFRLKDDIENKDIGITLNLSYNILKGDGEAFLRLLRSRQESSIYAGAAWRW